MLKICKILNLILNFVRNFKSPNKVGVKIKNLFVIFLTAEQLQKK